MANVYEVDLEWKSAHEDYEDSQLIKATITLRAPGAFSAVSFASQAIDGPYEVEVSQVRRQFKDGSGSYPVRTVRA